MDDDFLRELVEMNQDAAKTQTRYLGLKEAAADAKKSWESKVLAIQEAITNFGKELPLFDRKPGDDPPSDPGDGGGGGGDDGPDGPVSPPPFNGTDGGNIIDVEYQVALPAPPAPAVAFMGEPWRSESLQSLDQFGLSDKLIESMAESGLKTVGDLANYSNAGKRLTDIAGVGEKRADEIESAMEGFWADYRAKEVAAVRVDVERPRKSKKSA